jgi:hypothetical protein
MVVFRKGGMYQFYRHELAKFYCLVKYNYFFNENLDHVTRGTSAVYDLISGYSDIAATILLHKQIIKFGDPSHDQVLSYIMFFINLREDTGPM